MSLFLAFAKEHWGEGRSEIVASPSPYKQRARAHRAVRYSAILRTTFPSVCPSARDTCALAASASVKILLTFGLTLSGIDQPGDFVELGGIGLDSIARAAHAILARLVLGSGPIKRISLVWDL